MNEDQIKALQEEIAALRSKAKRRSFRQVLKDARKKLNKILYTEEDELTFQELITRMLFIMTSFIIMFSLLMLAAYIVAYTKALIFLLIPAYLLYFFFKKDTNG